MAHSPSDLRLLLDESAGHGSIDTHDHALLTRSLELSGLTANDAMTHRREIVSVDANSTAAEVAAEAHASGRTRVVVVDGDLDHPVGFIHAKDLIRLRNGSWSSTKAASIVRELMVTPQHHRLEDLLLEMRTDRQHIALVVDEHGTVVGVVTLEDVIEVLIGDFHDESDHRSGGFVLERDGTFTVSGGARPDQFETHTGAALPSGEWQTVAGYVIDACGEIPDVGDSVDTEVGTFTVLERDGLAISQLRVRLNSRQD